MRLNFLNNRIWYKGEQEVENELADNFNAYPVLTLGVGYFF